jgi:hypothetical protein
MTPYVQITRIIGKQGHSLLKTSTIPQKQTIDPNDSEVNEILDKA